jgi:hypothetical protein
MCATGGTLETQITRVSGGDDRTGNTGRVKKKVYNDPDRNFGKESRSLKACYEALQVRVPLVEKAIVRLSAVFSPRSRRVGDGCLTANYHQYFIRV